MTGRKTRMKTIDVRPGETEAEAEARQAAEFDQRPEYEYGAERKGPAVPQGPEWGQGAPTPPPERPGRVERTDAPPRPAPAQEPDRKPTKAALAALATPASYPARSLPQAEREAIADFEPVTGPPPGFELEDTPSAASFVAVAEDVARRHLPPSVVKDAQGTNVIRHIPVDELFPCPTNPRKDVAEITELAESVGKVGILQALVARPREEGGFWIVFGHRRHAAARVAGLAAVPVDVRELTDQDVLELQIVENVQRVDIAPLEEGEAYRRLRDDFGRTVDQIAERVGKSKRWVYTRIQLTDLAPEARRALQSGQINASVALELARVPVPKLQVEATKRVIDLKEQDGSAPSVKDVQQLIREDYTTELRGAPFSTKDQYLVPEAGPCTTCPKRSGNQPDLLAELKRADVCTDLPCYRSKVDAAWAQTKERAEAAGKVVLSQADGRRIFKHGAPDWNAPWVECDAVCPEDRQKKRTWRALLEGKLAAENMPTVHVAPDKVGKPRELFKRTEALAAARAAGFKWALAAEVEAEKQQAPTEDEVQKSKREADVFNQVERTVMARAAEAAAPEWDLPILRMVALAMVQTGDVIEVFERRELTIDKCEAWVKKATGDQLRGLIFELAVTPWISGTYREYSDELRAVAKAFKISIPEIEKAVRTTLEADSLFKSKPADEEPAPAKKKSSRAK